MFFFQIFKNHHEIHMSVLFYLVFYSSRNGRTHTTHTWPTDWIGLKIYWFFSFCFFSIILEMISTNNHHDDDDDVCLFVFVIENNISLSSLNFLFLFFSQIFVNLISLIIKVVRVVEMNFMALIMTHQKQKKIHELINEWMIMMKFFIE